MNSKGIPFNDEMIRALLNTKPGVWPAEPIDPSKPWKWQTRRICDIGLLDPFNAPYGPVGRHLWVRENFRVNWWDKREGKCKEEFVIYKADNPLIPEYIAGSRSDRWRSLRFMPKAISRIELEVKKIRIERVQNISEEDALAESCRESLVELSGKPWTRRRQSARFSFSELWEKIHGPGSWEKNDFVFAYDFMRVK